MKEHHSIFVETRSGGVGHIFAENRSIMLEIDYETYREVAGKLAEAVGARDFFNGTVSCDHREFSSSLTATLLIYRNEDTIPEGGRSTLTDVVPVWWEFCTVLPDGNEMLNGFSFTDFKETFLELCAEEDI